MQVLLNDLALSGFDDHATAATLSRISPLRRGVVTPILCGSSTSRFGWQTIASVAVIMQDPPRMNMVGWCLRLVLSSADSPQALGSAVPDMDWEVEFRDPAERSAQGSKASRVPNACRDPEGSASSYYCLLWAICVAQRGQRALSSRLSRPCHARTVLQSSPTQAPPCSGMGNGVLCTPANVVVACRVCIGLAVLSASHLLELVAVPILCPRHATCYCSRL
ncbi:hypothetical protein C8Q80DRAFT_137406 [Daedaleopsis nitida]|nr:hypothetical protein C8Q80DRAFT_137406 [Daedaleopsis nitida]